jgi:hypothetical protein
MQQQMYQQAPPVPPVPQGYGANIYSNSSNPQQPTQASYNPFFNSQQPPQLQAQPQQQQQQQQQPPLMVNTMTGPGGYGSNPFTRSPTRIQSPTLTQIPEQSQQDFYNPSPLQNQYSTAPQPQHSYYTPTPAQPQQQQHSYYSSSSQLPQQQWQTLPQQQQHPLQPQHTNNPFTMPQQPLAPQTHRPDNASIMALYALSPAPATAPAQPQQQQQQQQQQQAPPQQLSAFDQMFGQAAPQQAASQQVPVSTASKNPFLGTSAGPRTDQGGVTANPSYKHNVSRDSMMALGMEWSNGRHSPDAFASLSARQ